MVMFCLCSLNLFILINARHLILNEESGSPTNRLNLCGLVRCSVLRIDAARRFRPLIGDVLAVAWVEGTEQPFGLIDEPISGPVPVFSLEFCQLDVEATAVFQVFRWLAARLAAQLSG